MIELRQQLLGLEFGKTSMAMPAEADKRQCRGGESERSAARLGYGIMNNTQDPIMSITPTPISQPKALDFQFVANKP